MSSDIPSPGSIPRNCDATYRGNLGNKPERRQTRSGGEIVRARLAVNMAASSIPAEERDRFTEWLTVVCFAPAQMDRLERCEKGELITVNGPVTWREYTPDEGEPRIEHTIVGEYVRSASASMPPDAGGPPHAHDRNLPV